MKRVFCVGELLIDWVCTEHGVSLAEGSRFEKKAGGAPANVAAAVARLGGEAVFMGRVGEDPFGDFLVNTLRKERVDVSMIDRGGSTTFAFVSLKADGERDFVFCRGADGEYSLDRIDLSRLRSGDILHFGSATAWLPGELRVTVFQLLSIARDRGMFISFDPNHRDALIHDLESFRRDCLHFLEHARFVKMSEEEAMLVSGVKDPMVAVNVLMRHGPDVLCVTMGASGTLLATRERMELVPSVRVKQVDSTGAGDAFVGAMLYRFAGEERLEEALGHHGKLAEFVRFANRAGAAACTGYGAIASLPTLEQVLSL
ncbi:carbohydrate kinase family protein [Staphylospora marina]|uniref:carbohydrate kinase family protein n=1 Tax=Staphylospora marina TaxID=2490858 RepID=UPI000F5BA8E8|nr:carbohydrate kinase [Staphylospora marina]